MHWRHPTTLLLLAATVACGCGGAGGGAPAPAPVVHTVPKAERSVQRAGTITVRGDYAPDSHGPYTLDGRYRISFAQFGDGVDFRQEVPFTARLEQAVADGPGRRIPLFQRAARAGSKTIEVHGRYDVVVDYGDSPYELVLRPLR
ncbi:hypothetical protein FSW04_17525 [Baekduia soli]|uniref:Lipoprotein n=1 Tax=Baekduia soli TaxID=496014 RepID=A0A5B8U858_9ACTN|nr:hypothetical protein [Baekduia soli]QEC49200.1 hypothetical protein FSW04_17525 [Baekduia soli]